MGSLNLNKERKGAGAAGANAAMVAGLPGTGVDAARRGAMQDFNQRTAETQLAMRQEQGMANAQGLGMLLKLIASSGANPDEVTAAGHMPTGQSPYGHPDEFEQMLRAIELDKIRRGFPHQTQFTPRAPGDYPTPNQGYG